MKYKSGYKYQLYEDCSIELPFACPNVPEHEFIKITDGVLRVIVGYAWDGPSGPTIDTPNFMRGSLFHDALYQLMSQGLLGLALRIEADKLLRRVCLSDGMSEVRAWYVYQAVRLFGLKYAEKQPEVIYES